MCYIFEDTNGAHFIENYRNFLIMANENDSKEDIEKKLNKTLEDILMVIWNEKDDVPFYLGDSIYAIEYLGYAKINGGEAVFTERGIETIKRIKEGQKNELV